MDQDMMMVAADYKRHRNGIIAQDTGWLAQAPSKRGVENRKKKTGRMQRSLCDKYIELGEMMAMRRERGAGYERRKENICLRMQLQAEDKTSC
jgi:hypothetical protein